MYLKKTLHLFLLLFFYVTSLVAQESSAVINGVGKDRSKLKHTWNAQWITHPNASTLDYGVFNFRNTFNLKRIPESLIVHVSADNRYRLYVNGESVAFGPSVGDINNYRYETIDIAKYLKQGKNIIAAEVVNFGEYRRGAQQTFQTAFILQDESDDIDLNTGKSNWKVLKNSAYECIPFTSDSLKAYYCAGPGEKINANIYPWGWKESMFDDQHWVQPKLGTVEFAVGRGFLYGSTWFLVPRQIPFMEESLERFKSIDRISPEIEIEAFIEKGKSTTIPPNTKVSILLDNERHTTGYPELIISKGKNTQIKTTYSEALYLDPNNLSTDTLAHFSAIDLKGNRNDIEGKKIRGYYDLLIADGGLNRKYKPFGQKTFRYVQLDIQTQDEELVLNDYYNVYTVYPFEEKASFKTENKELTKIWDAAWLTLRNSASETFFDPYYEQLQYIGDTRVEALVSIYVSGDDALMRKAIQQFDDSRLPNGLTQSRYPSYIVQVIPPYSLLWIGMVHDFLMYRQDADFVKTFVPGIKTVLDWFVQNIDETGMATNLEWWNFTDWSTGFINGIPPGADNGYSANINLQFVYALQNALEIFEHLGLNDEVGKYSDIKDKVQSAVLKTCYNTDKGLIAETSSQDIYSQHSNIWGILTNTIPEDKQELAMSQLLEDESMIQATLYFRFYLFRALQKVGMGDKYTELLQPWKNMIADGLTTFGEKDKISRSDCHGWSASPCFDYLHLIAGIYPTSPEFKTMAIEPNFGDLNSLNVDFPHPEGNVHMELTKKKNKVKGKIIIPSGVEADFIWMGKKHKLKNGENEINY